MILTAKILLYKSKVKENDGRSQPRDHCEDGPANSHWPVHVIQKAFQGEDWPRWTLD